MVELACILNYKSAAHNRKTPFRIDGQLRSLYSPVVERLSESCGLTALKAMAARSRSLEGNVFRGLRAGRETGQPPAFGKEKQVYSSRSRTVLAAMAVFLVSTATSQTPQTASRIRLATTTSTEQSGLLAYMLPVFEARTGYKVDVIAVGTGASIKIGEKGDCDVVLSHARSLEDAFMASGFGGERRDVMYNDFIVIGPAGDPAGLGKEADAKSVFMRIFGQKPVFVSRGDNSGTHVKEKELWAAARVIPSGAWYKEAGQGMSQVLMMAAQMGAYTFADRATWLAVKVNLPGLSIVFEKDPSLLNPYGIMTVNPARWPHVNAAGARALVEFFTGPEGRALIQGFRIGGTQCFYL